jgi:hypothetical protein
MSKQLKNKLPTDCDKGEVKRERISLSNHFGNPKAKTINKRERSAMQSEIIIFFPLKTSFLKITKKTAKESHSKRERERERKENPRWACFSSHNVQGIKWSKTRTLSGV